MWESPNSRIPPFLISGFQGFGFSWIHERRDCPGSGVTGGPALRDRRERPERRALLLNSSPLSPIGGNEKGGSIANRRVIAASSPIPFAEIAPPEIAWGMIRANHPRFHQRTDERTA